MFPDQILQNVNSTFPDCRNESSFFLGLGYVLFEIMALFGRFSITIASNLPR